MLFGHTSAVNFVYIGETRFGEILYISWVSSKYAVYLIVYRIPYRSRRASCMSRCITVTRFACIAHRFLLLTPYKINYVSSNK
jgi:hypothetical protein